MKMQSIVEQYLYLSYTTSVMQSLHRWPVCCFSHFIRRRHDLHLHICPVQGSTYMFVSQSMYHNTKVHKRLNWFIPALVGFILCCLARLGLDSCETRLLEPYVVLLLYCWGTESHLTSSELFSHSPIIYEVNKGCWKKASCSVQRPPRENQPKVL